jgi:hypothetical protein
MFGDCREYYSSAIGEQIQILAKTVIELLAEELAIAEPQDESQEAIMKRVGAVNEEMTREENARRSLRKFLEDREALKTGQEAKRIDAAAVPNPSDPSSDEVSRVIEELEKPDGRAGGRGRPGNLKRHCDIAAIALKYGKEWPDHLKDICTDIDTARISPRYTENWRETWLETFVQFRGPELVKKAIQASVNAAKKT